MTTINIRADEQLKKNSTEIFNEMGLDMSGAITLFLQQVVITESIPFPIKTANGFSKAEESLLVRERKKMIVDIKKGKTKLYSSAEDLTSDLLD
ncbi:MAG: type II toxin-antitoxin system RelB/DinJ family antitoxin [Candidatus Gracilibacteria bacterium]